MISIRFVAMVIAVAGLFAAVPGAAARQQGPLPYRPDGWIRYHSFHSGGETFRNPSAWKGDDIYNFTANNQTIKRTAAGVYEPGDYFVFQVLVQNDGAPDRFLIQAGGNGDWTVKYFVSKTNVTSDVVAGTYRTPSLATGEMLLMKVKLWVGDPGTFTARKFVIWSDTNPLQRDTVKLKVTYSSCGC